MTKYYKETKPIIVDAVQFRKSKTLPEHALYQIHKHNDRFIFVSHINYQAIINDKDWIIVQSDGIVYIMNHVHFEGQFKKVIEVKEPKKKKVVDV